MKATDVESLLKDEIRKRMKKKDIQGQLDKLVDDYFEKLDLSKKVKSYLDERIRIDVNQYLDYLENGEDDPYDYDDVWDDQIKKKFKSKLKDEFKDHLEKNPILSDKLFKRLLNKMVDKGCIPDAIENGDFNDILIEYMKGKLSNIK